MVAYFVVVALSILIVATGLDNFIELDTTEPAAQRLRHATATTSSNGTSSSDTSNRRYLTDADNIPSMNAAMRTMMGLDMDVLNYEGGDMTKADCRPKYGRLRYFGEKEKRSPPMLYTYPGSGNTWGRLLIEHATGIYSGSIYNDATLVNELPGEFTCDRSVSVIKVHPHTHTATKLLNGGFHSDNMKCKRGGLRQFDKAILLVRDPFDSIWSEFQRRVTQSHVKGIPESYFDWPRWQANAANMANTYYRMWHEHYTLIEKQLKPQNVLYLRYEDLKSKTQRVNALHRVAKFLGVDVSAEQLYCSFVLAENPGAHRNVDATMMTKKAAYTRPLVCRMWALFGEYAARVGYQRRDGPEGDFGDCPAEHAVPVEMVNVGPQGDYNDAWVKAGKAFLDFGEHPPNGPNAGKRLFGPYPGVEMIRGYNPGKISNGPHGLGQGTGAFLPGGPRGGGGGGGIRPGGARPQGKKGPNFRGNLQRPQ